MSDLIKLYEGLLDVVNMKIDNDGMIYLELDGIITPVEIEGVVMYIPTDRNVSNMVDVSGGKPRVNKIMFNPLEEDAVKGSNRTFIKYRDLLQYRLAGAVTQLAASLMNIINTTGEEIEDIELVKFVNVINRVKSREKHLIDDKSVTNWTNLCNKIVTGGNKVAFTKFFVKRGGKIGNTTYNRVGTITFPFVDKLIEASEGKEPFLGVKLRRKDYDVYKSIFVYLMQTLEPTDINQYGSLNTKSPSMHVLLLMYNSIHERFKPVVESLRAHGIEDDELEMINIKPLPIRVEVFSDLISNLENEVRRVPTDASMSNRRSEKPAIINQTGPGNAKTKSSGSFWERNNRQASDNERYVREPQQQRQGPVVMDPPRQQQQSIYADRRPRQREPQQWGSPAAPVRRDPPGHGNGQQNRWGN